jgi:hypothetical protein
MVAGDKGGSGGVVPTRPQLNVAGLAGAILHLKLFEGRSSSTEWPRLLAHLDGTPLLRRFVGAIVEERRVLPHPS